jgi:hypothetical protein
VLQPIEICDESGVLLGFLRPIEEASQATIKLLTEWRNQVREWFLNTDKVTLKSTREWLDYVLTHDHKFMFWIETAEGERVGTYGYTVRNEHTIEFGNLLRGRPGGHRKLVYYAEIALIRHVFSQGYVAILCEVLSHNEKVLKLHASTGAVIFKEIGLRNHEGLWIEDGSGTDGTLIYQLHTPQTHALAVQW